MKIKRKRRRSMDKEIEEEHEEIKYEDTSVRELLTMMKDYSELIIDLAYAAIVFENSDLADEVGHLESEMDKMMYLIRLKSMLSARTLEDAERLSGLLQVASSAEKISDAAEDMVEILDLDVDVRPIMPHILSEADEKIHTLKIFDNSDVVGRLIGELRVESFTGVRIIAIRRQNRWVYGPDGHNDFKAGDIIIVCGVDAGFEELKEVTLGRRSWSEVMS